MTTNVKSVLEQIEDLSVADLFTLQERITSLLRQKTTNHDSNNGSAVSGNGHKQETQSETTNSDDEEPDRIYPYPGSPIYRYTSKGARKALEAMFTPEELEAAANFKPITLPNAEKTMAQYINEARDEERS